MKSNKIIIVFLLAFIIIVSACGSKKQRYNQCPTFGTKIEHTEKAADLG